MGVNTTVRGLVPGNDADLPLRTPLHHACASRSGDGNLAKLVKELIEKKANIWTTDSFGWTPLHLAAMHGKIKVVKVLKMSIEHPTEQQKYLHKWTNEGHSAIHLASRYGHVQVLKELCVSKEDATEPARDGRDAKRIAHECDKTDAWAYLDSVCHQW